MSPSLPPAPLMGGWFDIRNSTHTTESGGSCLWGLAREGNAAYKRCSRRRRCRALDPPSSTYCQERSTRTEREKNRVVLRLLPEETSDIMMGMAPSISTVTFFVGDHRKAAAFLRRRVEDIVRANPWLI